MIAPPRIAVWLAGLRVDRAEREFALGDLAEDFDRIARVSGPRAARRWYWRQALNSAAARNRAPGFPMRNFINELRTSLRQILRAPAASSAAILTYALGIGANVAIFSVAWPALVAPLPFPEEDRLTAIWLTYPGRDNTVQTNQVSPGDFTDLKEAQSFSDMAAYTYFQAEANVDAGGEPRQLQVGQVAPNFFNLMGVRPLVGRVILPSDAGSDRQIVVLSEAAWRTMFGGEASIVGRSVRVDGEPKEVIGVVPSTAGLGTIDPDAFTPLELPPGRERRRAYYLRVVARLAPGVSLDSANEELRTIMARAAVEFPASNRILSARAYDFREELVGPIRTSLLVLVGGAALVLLVACVNLGGLQIARNLHRARELGIRHALGASRLRLLGQLVAENVTLALAGGLVAIVFATLTLRAVASVAPANDWHTGQTASLSAVLIFTVALALITGFVVGLIPAWRATAAPRPEASYARGSTASRAAGRARIGIIAAQVSLSVVLLIVATLVASSLARVLNVNPGFRFDEGLVADLTLPDNRYESAASKTQFFDALIERIEALPGVARACAIDQVPLDTARGGMTWIAEGATRPIPSDHKSASPGCYDVLGLPLVRGRLPAAREAEAVAVINMSMARRLWPDGSDPIGKRMHMGIPTGPLVTVVGLVGDIRNTSLERRPGNQVWVPHSGGYPVPRRLAVRAQVPAATLAPDIRRILSELDPGLALANIRTMDDIVSRATAPRRFMLLLLGGFAVIALVLSAVGIYGVLAHLVGQRAREIGIRRALGASTAHVTRVVAGSTGIAILVGTVAGLAGAWGLSTIVASLLFEMSATEPRVYAGVAIFVSAAAALAAWPPARRATRVDPLRALRQE